MSWSPEDVVSDPDLVDYESQVLDVFGVADWRTKRAKAIEDWLWPRLRTRGLDPARFRTRVEADLVYGYTGSAYTDYTAASLDGTEGDINLNTVFATVGTDRIYIGSTQPFRGLFVRLLDAVSAVSATLSVAYWNGAWATFTDMADGTAVNGNTFAQGGSVTWDMPSDWTPRKVNSQGPYYWVRLSTSATPTALTATTQLAVIRASALRAPLTYKTLALIYHGAPIARDGPWTERASRYDTMADEALEVAWPLLGAEFDTDESDVLSEAETEQTTETVATRGGWTLERA